LWQCTQRRGSPVAGIDGGRWPLHGVAENALRGHDRADLLVHQEQQLAEPLRIEEHRVALEHRQPTEPLPEQGDGLLALEIVHRRPGIDGKPELLLLHLELVDHALLSHSWWFEGP